MGCVWKRCAADRIHNTITKNLYTSEKQNKIIYTKKNPNDPSFGFFQTVDKTLLVSTPEAFFLFWVQKVCT